jgi:hypothetical protein
MNRMIRAAAAAAILTSGLGSVGCVGTGSCGSGGCGPGGALRGNRDEGHGPIGDLWRNFVDPCNPERYNYAARQAVLYPFGQQVQNGHFLNQTIWNYYFETGTDKLTPAGFEKLDSLARTRPAPDPKLYIQAAVDLAVTDANAAKINDMRAELDVKRAAAIQKYLATVPAVAPVAYEVYVHNAPVPSIIADAPAGAYRASLQGYRGGITGAAGIGALGTGGSTNLTVAPVINSGAAGASGSAGAGGGAGGYGGR